MRFVDYITMALRNIARQKLRSALTIFAVVIGATSVTIMLALVFGAKSFFIRQLDSTGVFQQVAVSAHSDISDFNSAQNNGGANCSACITLSDTLANKIKILPHVLGVARMQRVGQFQAISLDNKKLTLNNLAAYDANGIIISSVVAGRDLTQSDKTEVVTITSDYAAKFGYKGKYNQIIGKSIQLISQPGYRGVGAKIEMPVQCNGPCDNNQPMQEPPTMLSAKIVGVVDGSQSGATVRVPMSWAHDMNSNQSYQFTKADQEAQQAYCRLHVTNRNGCNAPQHMTLVITNYIDQNGYDSLTVKADKSTNAKLVTKEIKQLGVGAADAETSINSQLQIFNVLGVILGGIGGIALVVAAIGVINTMMMATLERTREIGVMRAVGARRGTVSRLFTIEASGLGFWGGVIGVAVGFGLTSLANVFINKQLASGGLHARNIITLPWWLIITVIAITTFIGMIAGLYPARRAARLDPVEALHYE
ncbi:MAG TPA: ABC transporter permease [Candidatus Saccharimonadales bacterium]|nr:ABC transporter permease [Candidatus Saccharimonadales bacterium]